MVHFLELSCPPLHVARETAEELVPIGMPAKHLTPIC
jgi:hypothetical protein